MKTQKLLIAFVLGAGLCIDVQASTLKRSYLRDPQSVAVNSTPKKYKTVEPTQEPNPYAPSNFHQIFGKQEEEEEEDYSAFDGKCAKILTAQDPKNKNNAEKAFVFVAGKEMTVNNPMYNGESLRYSDRPMQGRYLGNNTFAECKPSDDWMVIPVGGGIIGAGLVFRRALNYLKNR